VPAHGFRPHNAPLGITFVRNPKGAGRSRRCGARGAARLVERTKKDGYKVVSLHWEADGKIVERDFLSASRRTRT
jgi:hypothetical protein